MLRVGLIGRLGNWLKWVKEIIYNLYEIYHYRIYLIQIIIAFLEYIKRFTERCVSQILIHVFNLFSKMEDRQFCNLGEWEGDYDDVLLPFGDETLEIYGRNWIWFLDDA